MEKQKQIKASIFLHGTFLEVFSKGVLIRGESLSGKSALAFELVKRGHFFIADDLVKITKRNQHLIGTCARGEKLIEIRPFGIFLIEDIFGKKSIKDEKKVDIIVDLNEKKKKQINILGISFQTFFIDSSCMEKKICFLEKIALLEGIEKKLPLKRQQEIKS